MVDRRGIWDIYNFLWPSQMIILSLAHIYNTRQGNYFNTFLKGSYTCSLPHPSEPGHLTAPKLPKSSLLHSSLSNSLYSNCLDFPAVVGS